MRHVAACLSMIHEPAPPRANSATRPFRDEPVLVWTLRRLGRAAGVSSMTILCWEDQLSAVEPIAGEAGANVLVKGPRAELPHVVAIAAARRWSDGWRGGLLGTCEFDRGLHAPWLMEIASQTGAGALLLVDPAAALVDPVLIDHLIAHADAAPAIELAFTQAAPGLCGVVVRPSILEALRGSGALGRSLHYLPAQPVKDPIAGEGCCQVPTPVARSTQRFTLDSERQVGRITLATQCLNGQLLGTEAEQLVARLSAHEPDDTLPRELTVELTTRRATRPLFWPGHYATIEREELSAGAAESLLDGLGAAAEDVRLTLGGVGDPLLAGGFERFVRAATAAGIMAIHVETDLLGIDTRRVELLAQLPIDVLSVHLPAFSAETYAKVMGVDEYARVLDNLRTLLVHRQQAGRLLPIIVPIFTKLRENLGEMEAWYDQWLGALGSASIVGPTECGGIVPDLAVADMSPPVRRACARLGSRLTVLCDGRAVTCEQDVLGRQPLGHIGELPLSEIWQGARRQAWREHKSGRWTALPVCAPCREWHRP